MKFESRSQCRQDLIIAMFSDWQRHGQVIEVGATDGIFFVKLLHAGSGIRLGFSAC